MAKKKPKTNPPPDGEASVLAEKPIIEVGTSNLGIIGIFNGFVIPTFPGIVGPARIFLQLVDGIGRCDLTVEIHDLQENTVIARSPKLTVEFPERLNGTNLIIEIPPIQLNHAGAYDVVVLSDNQELDRQKFFAQQQSEPQEVTHEPSEHANQRKRK